MRTTAIRCGDYEKCMCTRFFHPKEVTECNHAAARTPGIRHTHALVTHDGPSALLTHTPPPEPHTTEKCYPHTHDRSIAPVSAEDHSCIAHRSIFAFSTTKTTYPGHGCPTKEYDSDRFRGIRYLSSSFGMRASMLSLPTRVHHHRQPPPPWAHPDRG